jgi:hypothetical protein
MIVFRVTFANLNLGQDTCNGSTNLNLGQDTTREPNTTHLKHWPPNSRQTSRVNGLHTQITRRTVRLHSLVSARRRPLYALLQDTVVYDTQNMTRAEVLNYP